MTNDKKFILHSEMTPKGDQPQAIERMVKALGKGVQNQTLLGVTGSGKTFAMAKVVEAVQRPTLVLAHNKTLAAQLCSEFQEFFPENPVSYFVSYYDYYQPEAYMPATDTYIEKDASINEEIDKFRHAATANLLSRKDVLIVASVSCIYGLGSVEVVESGEVLVEDVVEGDEVVVEGEEVVAEKPKKKPVTNLESKPNDMPSQNQNNRMEKSKWNTKYLADQL